MHDGYRLRTITPVAIDRPRGIFQDMDPVTVTDGVQNGMQDADIQGQAADEQLFYR